MLERIVVLEEPFAEENTCDVRGLPVMVAADESAHSPEDVKKRIALGYRAIALKPSDDRGSDENTYALFLRGFNRRTLHGRN